MGTRSYCICTAIFHWDHPHAYGDKDMGFGGSYEGEGSSPRVWGQVIFKFGTVVNERIIPTRMGTRQRKVIALASIEDHPHAYGDKPLTQWKNTLGQGSSPRVWGQGSYLVISRPLVRIIPTRMGTSGISCISYLAFQDHPHAYGDKLMDLWVAVQQAGSSPRVWGQVLAFYMTAGRLGIIPTRMGTSKILFVFKKH